tara:strand:- start:2058 stop:3374 length:1317 start_codon:yes stop_codon:yes gene_type:complete
MNPSAFLSFVVVLCLGSAALAKNPAFEPVIDDPALPRVLLIGDSISIGYTVAVQELMAGKANVHRIPTNAGHTGMGLDGLPKWFEKMGRDWDVIHFNWGLWDLCYRHPEAKTQGKRDKVNGTQTHTIEQYVANLDNLVTQLQSTGAKLIFATTTPVPEGEFGRKIGDDLRYNAAAVELMNRHGITINDLNAVMAGKMSEFGVKPGDVHFKQEGSQLLAQHVAEHLLKALSEPITLYDGKNLAAWEFAENAWEILEDGSVVCRMKEGVDKKGNPRTIGMGDIWTRQEFSDFDLTLSYKLSVGANSGVFYRADKNNPVQGGFEVQLMDNEGFQKTHGARDARKLNGSFYDGKAPSHDPSNPPGEWNRLQLTCEGPRIRIAINGEQVIDVNVDDWDTAGQNPDGTTNKFKTAFKDLPRTGRIGLQNHGQVVWFKDIVIRSL